MHIIAELEGKLEGFAIYKSATFTMDICF